MLLNKVPWYPVTKFTAVSSKMYPNLYVHVSTVCREVGVQRSLYVGKSVFRGHCM